MNLSEVRLELVVVIVDRREMVVFFFFKINKSEIVHITSTFRAHHFSGADFMFVRFARRQ